MHDLMNICGAHLARQGGLITRSQLLCSDLGDRQVEGLVRRRRLAPVAPGVYRVADHAPPREQAAWAAVLATGGRLIGEHLFALLDIECGSFGVPPTVLVPPGTPPRRGLDVRLVHGELGRGEARDVLGIPAASIARAAVEHATDHPLRLVRRVVDSGRWLGELAIPPLLGCAVARPPDHLGAQKIRWMHEAGLFADESEGERTLDRALGTLGLLFRRQVDDVVPGRRFDRYCDLARLALEYDGRPEERDLNRDATKDLVAASHHVLVLHVTKEMVRPGAVQGTVEMIARQVEERGRTRP